MITKQMSPLVALLSRSVKSGRFVRLMGVTWHRCDLLVTSARTHKAQSAGLALAARTCIWSAMGCWLLFCTGAAFAKPDFPPPKLIATFRAKGLNFKSLDFSR